MTKDGYCGHEKEHELALQRAKEEILSPRDSEKICKIFYLLSDVGRFRLVYALLQGDMCVYHLTEVADGTQSGVSHQLRILRDNGIVKAKRVGKFMEYSIADGHIREIIETGVKHLACARD